MHKSIDEYAVSLEGIGEKKGNNIDYTVGVDRTEGIDSEINILLSDLSGLYRVVSCVRYKRGVRRGYDLVSGTL